MTTMRESYVTALDEAENDEVYIRLCLFECRFFDEPCYVVTLVQKDNPDQTDYEEFATFEDACIAWDFYESLLEENNLIAF